MMKKVNIYCNIFLLFCLYLVNAQDNGSEPDSLLTELFAQRFRTKFSMSGSLGSFGSTASLVGESVVWPKSDASSLCWNPAALGFLENRSVITDFVPGFLQDISKFYDAEKEVAKAMDEAIEENGKAGSEVEHPVLSTKVGFESSIAGFGLAVPFSTNGLNFGVGFGYSTPLILNFQLIGTGIEAGIETEEELAGEGLTTISMRVRANLNSNFLVSTNQIFIGAGCDFGNGLALGFSVNRFQMHVSSNAYASIDGIISITGSEYAFNDPYDPKIDFEKGEQNDINQSFYADFTGSGWGYKFGIVQKVTNHFQLGMTISFPPEIQITGMDSTRINKIPFINEGDEMIDATEIDLAKITKTESDIQKNQFSPVLQLSKSYSFGFVLGGDGLKFMLRYTKYNGSFSFGLLEDDIRGIKLTHGAGIGLDFKYFFFGASASTGEEIVPAGKESILPIVILPKVNLGFRIPTFSGMWIDGVIGVEPIPLLRFTLRYGF